MVIIAGLGNPGGQYAHTRHNAGFDAVDLIAEAYGISMTGKKYRAVFGKGSIEGCQVLLVKPQTFMNLSGESIRAFIDFYKIDPSAELIVLYDDISLAPGSLRIRKKGSAGGHNGIKSIIAHLDTQEFLRVKIGVGEKPRGWDLADYVLSRFPAEDRTLVEEALNHAAEAVKVMLSQDISAAMNRFN